MMLDADVVAVSPSSVYRVLKAAGLLADARSLVESYVGECNTERLHSAIGYIAPRDKLEGRAPAIFAARREKLAMAAKAGSDAYERQRQVQTA